MHWFADMPFYICSTHMTTVTNGAQRLVGVTFYLLNKWPAFCPFSTLRWTRSWFILGRAVIVLWSSMTSNYSLHCTQLRCLIHRLHVHVHVALKLGDCARARTRGVHRPRPSPAVIYMCQSPSASREIGSLWAWERETELWGVTITPKAWDLRGLIIMSVN